MMLLLVTIIKAIFMLIRDREFIRSDWVFLFLVFDYRINWNDTFIDFWIGGVEDINSVKITRLKPKKTIILADLIIEGLMLSTLMVIRC